MSRRFSFIAVLGTLLLITAACTNKKSVNPGFGGRKFIPSTLHKMRRLAEIRRERGLQYRIEVDGGISLNTVAEVGQAGAEISMMSSVV